MADDPDEFGVWQPWKPQEVADFFSGLDAPWWIAGGWALDLFLGQQTREHEDIDVQILRRDQQIVRGTLGTWNVQGAQPRTEPGEWPFREWETGTLLNSEVHDIWCRPTPTDPWILQLMVADTNGDAWLFRRDARIFRPLTAIGLKTPDGIPYLAPEIQLLYKARDSRPKDETDFARTLPYLGPERRQWLAQALTVAHPDHPWLFQIEHYS